MLENKPEKMKTFLEYNQFVNIYSEQLWLKFSEKQKEKARNKAKAQSNSNSSQNAYLNALAVEVLSDWLTTETDIEDKPKILPDHRLSSIWEFINGTAISLGKTKLVIIPTEGSTLEEFCVPQEWVDIPGWEADYYLAVEIELEEGWLRVWGYTTHSLLKNTATYDFLDKTYTANPEDLIADLNVMWTAISLNSWERVSIPPLAKLSNTIAEDLIMQWGKPLSYSPRILIPFPHWAPILDNETWRENLYQKRLSKVSQKVSTQKNDSVWIETTQWLTGKFVQGWQSIESFFQDVAPEMAFRSSSSPMTEKSTVKAIKLLDLTTQAKPCSVALLVERGINSEGDLYVSLQVRPAKSERYLPPLLKLNLIDENEEVQGSLESRNEERFMQLSFPATEKTRFKVQIILGDVSATENFII